MKFIQVFTIFAINFATLSVVTYASQAATKVHSKQPVDGPIPNVSNPGELVKNGGFETGDFTGFTLSGNTSPPLVGVDMNAPHSGNYAAFFGSIGSPGFLSQTVNTVPGQKYTFSFFLMTEPFAPVEPGISEFSAAVDDNPPFLDLKNNPPQLYTQYSQNFVARTSATDLTFGFRNDPSFFDLDDVSVTPTGTVSIVPEPSSLLSTVTFGATLAGYLLKRKSWKRV